MHLYLMCIINAMITLLYPIVLAVLCASVSHRCCVPCSCAFVFMYILCDIFTICSWCKYWFTRGMYNTVVDRFSKSINLNCSAKVTCFLFSCFAASLDLSLKLILIDQVFPWSESLVPCEEFFSV